MITQDTAFLTGIIHDLRNRLCAVMLTNDLAGDYLKIGDVDAAQEVVELNAATILGLARLVRGLYTTLYDDAFAKSVNVQTLVAELIEEYRNPVFQFSGHAYVPTVRVHVAQILHVMRNLVQNSIEASASEIAVHLYNSEDGKLLHIKVKDNGIGMSEATRLAMFIPKFSTKTGQERGMGLASCLGIIASSNGTIHCQSAVGEGTCFVLTFSTAA